MARRSIPLVIAIALALSGCGGSEDNGAGDAGEFSKTNIEAMVKGQWTRVYEDLHPAHQEVVSRDLYVDCRTNDTIPAYEVEVDEVYEETINVPRLGSVETTATTMKLTVGERSEYITRHLIEVDGDWKWISTEDALSAYEQGECS